MTTNIIPKKSSDTLRIVHTADWHLGKRLHDKQRYDEFEEFLAWLLGVLDNYSVDVLLVAGDIFDTMNPSHEAQKLYYHFLSQTATVGCQSVIIAGNHDSPTLLDAPKSFFDNLNINVIGTPNSDLKNNVLVLEKDNCPALIVAAVPFLRDKDVRFNEPVGQRVAQKEQQTKQGIADYYAKTHDICQNLYEDYANEGHQLPVVAMGHLFAIGASTSADDDGMREVYVGGLGSASSSTFGDGFDYVALGHIHKAQCVGNKTHIRYSGSPIAMGFGEANKQKSLTLVDFDTQSKTPKQPTIYTLPIPTFRYIKAIKGNQTVLEQQINAIKTDIATKNWLYFDPNTTISPKPLWLHIEYTGDVPISDFNAFVNQLVAPLGDKAVVIAAKNSQYRQAFLSEYFDNNQAIDDLDKLTVFNKLLDSHHFDDSTRQDLLEVYQQTLASLDDID